MTAYTSLPEILQTIFLYKAELGLKFILFCYLVALPLFYLFWYKKGQKPTELLSVGLARSVMTISSFFQLMVSPLLFLIFHPDFEFMAIWTVFMFIYLSNLVVFMWVAGMDAFRFFPDLLVNMSGIKVDSKYYNYVVGWFKRNFK